MKLSQTRLLLQERSAELAAFIEFLEISENEILGASHDSPLLPSTDISAIMKSTVLLMNYSLIEALIVELVDELFSIARSRNISLELFSGSVRNQIIRYRFRGLRDAGIQKIQDAVSELIDLAVSGSVIDGPGKQAIRDGFLGNLDARKVKSMAEQFGVEVKSSGRTRGGADLKEIKDSRNQLAHGRVSFVQLGQLKSASDLRLQTFRIVEYLISVIRCFEKGIRQGVLFTERVV